MSHNPDSLMPVSVGHNENGWTYKIQKGKGLGYKINEGVQNRLCFFLIK